MIQSIIRWTLVAVGPMALFAPKGLYLPLIIVSILGIFHHKFKERQCLVTPLWMVFLAFIVWMVLSVLWSMNPRIAVIILKKVVPILSCAPLVYLYVKSLSRFELDLHLRSFFWGMWVCVGLLVIDYFMDYPLIDIIHTNRSATYSRFMTTACLGVWVFELTQRYPKFREGFIAFSILTSAWVMWPYDFDAGPVALFFGCGVFGATLLVPKLVNRLLSIAIAIAPILIVLCVGLFMTQDHWQKIATHPSSSSAQQRIEMLDWAAKHALQSPVLGIGVGQAPELTQVSVIPNYVTVDGVFKTIHLFESGLLHLHNGLLQILLELGFVGSLLLGAFLFLALRQGCTQISDKTDLALMHGYVTSLIFIVSVSFGIWQIWWLSVIILLSVLFALRVSDEGQDSNYRG